MGRVHEAVLEFDYSDADGARAVARSVRVEVDAIGDDRSRATVTRDVETMTVTVRAADHSGLRAGLNTWSHLVSVAEQCAGAR